MPGKVWLVGAGPGDPTLITVKGLHCIRQADVLVYDRLVCKELLSEASAQCEMINVGKTPNFHPIPQEEINNILIKHALQGQNVVRLKGGDPYVFGRGGEEAEALIPHQIPFEVVPGITSAIGGLAYAGIPVTHRDCASSFHVITGHRKEGKDQVDWSQYAKLDGTLVVLMGMSQLDHICQSLVLCGKEASTPVAVVRYASRKEQQVVCGNLDSIATLVQDAGLRSPALIVIGKVAEKHTILEFTATHQEIQSLALTN